MPRIIDLTLPLAQGMGHPMFRKVHLAPYHVHEIHRRSNADLYMAIHTATHIDAPYHFVADGTTIDLVPLDRLIGEGVLFRLEDPAQARYRFRAEDLRAAAGESGSELRGKIAVVATGWSNRAFADEGLYYRESPALSPDAVRWLADGGVKAVVLDCATDAAEPVPVAEQATPIHRTLLGRGILIVENCLNLTSIPDGCKFTLYAIPLKIQAESGAPARVFAVVEDVDDVTISMG
jgi:kynurenine formamidase